MERLFEQICNLSISASWLMTAVFVMRYLLRNISKKYNYLLWLLVAIRLLLPFTVESSFCLVPNVNISNLSKVTNEVKGSEEISELLMDAELNKEKTVGVQVYQPVKSFHKNEGWPEKQSILPYIWFGGVMVMIAYFIGSSLWLNRKLSTAVRLKDDIWQSEYVDSPFIFGVIKPRIYIPYNLEEKTLFYVLAHEKIHMKNLDDWVKAAAFLVLSVYWFHPLVWASYTALCKDVEMACDEQVVEEMNTEERTDYSLALLSCQGKKRWYHACPVGFGEVDVKERVFRTLKYKKSSRGVILLVLFCCMILVVCFMTSRNQSKENKILIQFTEQSSENDSKNVEVEPPAKEKVFAMREQVLKGMTTEEIKRLKENIKTANQVMETAYLYHDIFGKLEDKESLYWNYFEQSGEIQIGWAENEKGEKTPVKTYNRFNADNFADLITDMKKSVQHEKLQADLQKLIDLTMLAKETHEMEYANEIYKILHDMDYFLLRYGPEDVGMYTTDDSIVLKYYGVLEAYEETYK